MSDALTKESVWEKVTHVKCRNCSTLFEAEGPTVDYPILSDDDVDDAYDTIDELGMTCCDDPSLAAVIVSPTPVFDHPLDDDFVARATGPTVFVPNGRAHDEWTYEVTDDFFDILLEAGLLDG